LVFQKPLGVDLSEAIKIFSKDLTSGMEGVDDLGKRLGGLTASQREYIQGLDANVDKSQRQAATIKFVADNIAKASDVTTSWGQRFTALGNIASNALRAITVAEPSGTGPLAGIQKQIEGLEKTRGSLGGLSLNRGTSEEIARLTAQITQLRLEATKMEANNLTAVFGEWGRAAVNAAEQLVPLRAQARELANSSKLLEQSRSDPNVRLTLGPDQSKTLDEAATKARVLAQMTRESADVEARHFTEVERVAGAYKGVTVQTALTLNVQKDQLAVASAVGGQARLNAQAEQRYNELVLSGVKSEEAVSIAAGERAIAQAQINTQARETLFQLQNQEQVARAVTGQEKIKANAAALYAQQVHDGVDANVAQANAAQYTVNANAQLESQGKNIIASMNDQVAVASAIGGQAKVAAEAQAVYNQMVREGYSASQALQASEAQRAAGIGAINVKMHEQLAALQDQGMVSGAATGAMKIAAQAQAAYNKAIREGASDSQAAAIAQQTYANGVGAANAAVENQIYEVDKQAELARVAGTSMEAATKAAYAYSDALRSGADEAHAFALEQAVLNAETAKYEHQAAVQRAQDAGGKYGQFITNQANAVITTFSGLYGQGGYVKDVQTSPIADTAAGFTRLVPNQQGLEHQVNSMFVQGKGLLEQIDNLINGPGLASRNSDYSQATAQTLQHLTDLLPDDQKSGAIQKELDALKSQPETLARDDLIKQLTDSLKTLTQATTDNTTAQQKVTDVLSPFYSSDPRSSHLGFRSFAGGGIMTSYGELPLHKYADSGVATSPQVALFGEGATPEAYVPAPSGHIPVTIQQPANSNEKAEKAQPPINVNIVVHGNADGSTVRALKATGFQQAQAMRRVVGR
jgi:hypothetical protein